MIVFGNKYDGKNIELEYLKDGSKEIYTVDDLIDFFRKVSN